MSGTPDYHAFLHEMSAPALLDVLLDVAAKVSDPAALLALAGDDCAAMNDAVDAQLDRLLAACGGSERIALFWLTFSFGETWKAATRS